MDAIIKEILNSPKFNFYLEELNQAAKEESGKRKEFYKLVSVKDRWEFINGEIIKHSPVRNYHSIASDNLFMLINAFAKKNDLGEAKHTDVMVSLTRNDYEPDIIFFKKERTGGFKRDQIQFPAPDFVVEVLSPSTEKYDRGVKFTDYALHGVKEYWMIDPDNEIVEQYLLKQGEFVLSLKSSSGNIKSNVIENFEIPIKAIFDSKLNLEIISNFLK
ncbi:MAG: Uma2 family endonuclease [Ignavibacteria bacterium]|nr:Uma2 family endonuclease [Ignavibacteria bacterium]